MKLIHTTVRGQDRCSVSQILKLLKNSKAFLSCVFFVNFKNKILKHQTAFIEIDQILFC